MEDPAYDGMWLHDDNGRIILANGDCGSNYLWDFRNQTAIDYHSNVVAGFFATQAGVDGVFFDEGDSLACQYSCERYGTCKTMPDAVAWQQGAIKAWLGAAKVMAAAGKRAILSSQNGFKGSTPEL